MSKRWREFDRLVAKAHRAAQEGRIRRAVRLLNEAVQHIPPDIQPKADR